MFSCVMGDGEVHCFSRGNSLSCHCAQQIMAFNTFVIAAPLCFHVAKCAWVFVLYWFGPGLDHDGEAVCARGQRGTEQIRE